MCREELIGYLRRGHKKRKIKKVGRKERRTKIPNRVSIEKRPVSVDNLKQTLDIGRGIRWYARRSVA